MRNPSDFFGTKDLNHHLLISKSTIYVYKNRNAVHFEPLLQRCTTFLDPRPQCLVHSRAKDKIMILTLKSQVSKTEIKIYLT